MKSLTNVGKTNRSCRRGDMAAGRGPCASGAPTTACAENVLRPGQSALTASTDLVCVAVHGRDWRALLAKEVEHLDAVIVRATAARDFLTHASRFPTKRPVQQCPKLIEALDRRLSGASFEDLAKQFGPGHGPTLLARVDRQWRSWSAVIDTTCTARILGLATLPCSIR